MDTQTELKNAIEQLRQKREASIAEYDADIAALVRAASVIARRDVSVVVAPQAPAVKAAQVSGEPAKPAEVAAAAVQVLSAGPVWRLLPALCVAIQETGVVIGGKDAVSNLSTILSRHKEALGFVGDKRRGWALRTRIGSAA